MQNVTITIKLPEVYYQVALQAHLLGEADLSQDKDATGRIPLPSLT